MKTTKLRWRDALAFSPAVRQVAMPPSLIVVVGVGFVLRVNLIAVVYGAYLLIWVNARIPRAHQRYMLKEFKRLNVEAQSFVSGSSPACDFPAFCRQVEWALAIFRRYIVSEADLSARGERLATTLQQLKTRFGS